mgnify:CR=1 FL=1
MERTWDLLPSKFEGTVKEPFAPSGGEICKVDCYHGLSRVISLDKGPLTLSVQEEVATTAVAINVHCDLGIVGDPVG